MPTRKKPGKVGENKSDIVREVPKACADELAAVEFIEARRWGDEPCCPTCGSVDVYKMTKRGTDEREKHYRWRCRDCGDLYSVRKGTVFEDSRIPMRYWCYGLWAMCSSKKGVNAMQIQRMTGLSYKSALFMLHRIRFAMADDDAGKLTGTVEADETYFGGKPRNVTPYGKDFPGRGKHRVVKPKTPVFAAVSRETGQVRARVMPVVTSVNLRDAIQETVCRNARLVTDEHPGYKYVGSMQCRHDTIKHSDKEYARDDVTTNTIEGFFSQIKRGVYGVYHNVSKEHLHRYVDEFAFRWNTRKVDDGARVDAVVSGAEGKRLMYRLPAWAE